MSRQTWLLSYQVLELLNHINKRVKALPSTQLPLIPLVNLALDGSSGPMVRSFALVYVELGQPRALPQQQLDAVSASLDLMPALLIVYLTHICSASVVYCLLIECDT